MNETNLTDTIHELAAPIAASLGLSLWGVDVAFGKKCLTRIFVESSEGVDIDKCAELSRMLGLALDVEDIIPCAYVLEVSSPGLERSFFCKEQLEAYVGSTIDVTLHAPVTCYPGRKKMLGKLVAAEKNVFSVLPLDVPEEKRVPALFTWADIKKAKLVYFLPELQAAVKGRKNKEPQKKAGATAKASSAEPIETEGKTR